MQILNGFRVLGSNLFAMIGIDVHTNKVLDF